MKEQTHRQIEEFFTHLKNLPEYYSIDNIKEVIGRPNVVPNHHVSNYASTFKQYFIMTSISAIIISTVVFFVTNEGEEKTIAPITEFQQMENPQASPKNDGKANLEEQGQWKGVSSKKVEIEENDKSTTLNHKIKETLTIKALDKVTNIEKVKAEIFVLQELPTINMSKSHCTWPSDTIIDGRNLILQLEKEELEKLGFLINNTGLYYKNEYQEKKAIFHTRKENGIGGMSYLSNKPNQHNEKTEFSHHDYPLYMTDYFFRVNSSNLSQGGFDDIKDTLVPVRVSDELAQNSEWAMPHTFWFRATPSLFNVLPERYGDLQNVYSCIEHVKKSIIIIHRQEGIS